MSISDKKINRWLGEAAWDKLLKNLDEIAYKERATLASQVGERKDPDSKDLLMALVKDDVPIVAKVACQSIMLLPLSAEEKATVEERQARMERKEKNLSKASESFYNKPTEEEERMANLRRAQEAPLRRAHHQANKNERTGNRIYYILLPTIALLLLLIRLLYRFLG